ncbi:hypothetical protein J2T16_005170 [Paenibacillus intestini]|nr:hypothetical protein [Paenibacillus intestini]
MLSEQLQDQTKSKRLCEDLKQSMGQLESRLHNLA